MSEDPPEHPTYADWLRLVGPRLAPTLVPDTALEPWLATTRSWPARGPAVLEIALGSDPPARVDFSWRLADPCLGVPAVGDFPPHASLDFVTEGWPSLGHPEPISSVWLELDAVEPRSRSFPMVIPKLVRRVEPEWLTESLLPALGIVAAEDPAFRRFVRRAAEAIPAPGRVLYVFSLAARGHQGLRLETVGLPVAAMPTVLADLAGRWAAHQVEAVVGLAEGVDRPHLSFDIDPTADGGRVGERIGVELGFRRQPDREPGWDRLLGRLEGGGLCTAEQRRALLAWCGHEHLRSAGDRWPAGARGHCICCLSHLKLVTRRGAPTRAKAYLLFENFVPARWESVDLSGVD